MLPHSSYFILVIRYIVTVMIKIRPTTHSYQLLQYTKKWDLLKQTQEILAEEITTRQKENIQQLIKTGQEQEIVACH